MTHTLLCSFEQISSLSNAALQRVDWNPFWIEDGFAYFNVVKESEQSGLLPGRYVLQVPHPKLAEDLTTLLGFRARFRRFESWSAPWTFETEQATLNGYLSRLKAEGVTVPFDPFWKGTSHVWDAVKPYRLRFHPPSEVERIMAIVCARTAVHCLVDDVPNKVLIFFEENGLVYGSDIAKGTNVNWFPEPVRISRRLNEILKIAAQVQRCPDPAVAVTMQWLETATATLLRSEGFDAQVDRIAQVKDCLQDLFYLLTRSPASRSSVLKMDLALADPWATRELCQSLRIGEPVP